MLSNYLESKLHSLAAIPLDYLRLGLVLSHLGDDRAKISRR
jgi:hypothetical protein